MFPPFDVVTKVMMKLFADMLSNLMLPDGLGGTSTTKNNAECKKFQFTNYLLTDKVFTVEKLFMSKTYICEKKVKKQCSKQIF